MFYVFIADKVGSESRRHDRQRNNLTGLPLIAVIKLLSNFNLAEIGGNETALQTLGGIHVRPNPVTSNNSDFGWLSMLLLFVYFDSQ